MFDSDLCQPPRVSRDLLRECTVGGGGQRRETDVAEDKQAAAFQVSIFICQVPQIAQTGNG